jgi:hypothetical protein
MWGALVIENSSIPIIPNCPRGEHGDGSHVLSIGDSSARHVNPSIFGGMLQVPSEMSMFAICNQSLVMSQSLKTLKP